ncbi:unnamed protein product [Oikopleura dioica]|uniref:Meiosis-specific nuclear structural protein 1 n=1 Tax=Oikopleura dioica TaxID=34765 RepID=E4WX07_OIKDI|nr:unnamed protein product [Oikopleura dioica]
MEEEEEYRRQMMEKFAEDDRIEQMNAQKRRMKQLEHKRAVEEIIQHRRDQHKLEHEAELADREREKAEARRRAEIIEEERQKLLAAHAKNVLGYLPKGVIRDNDDIARLGTAYADAYAPTSRRDFEAQYIVE